MLKAVSELKSGQSLALTHFYGSSASYMIAHLLKHHNAPILMITDDMQQTHRYYEEIACFNSFESHLFTDWETLPYDSFSPNHQIVSERLACLHGLPLCKRGITILPITTLMQKVCPPSFLAGHVFLMKKGQQLSREHFRTMLESSGYRSVNQVMEHGEFATRGAIFDLFPMGSDLPYRLDFFDDEIDSIKSFDINTQLTVNSIEQIELLPAHEFPFDKSSIELFREQFRAQFDAPIDDDSVYQQVSNGILPTGIEYWQPLFFNKPLVSFFTYLPKNTLIITTEQIHLHAEKFWHDIHQRFDSRNVDPLRPLLKPTQLWQTVEQLFGEINQFAKLTIGESNVNLKHFIEMDISPLPKLAIQMHDNNPYAEYQAFTNRYLDNIIFSVTSEGRKEAVLTILRRIQCFPVSISHPNEIIENQQKDHKNRFFIMISPYEQGFIDNKAQFALITEFELLGERIIKRKKESKSAINTEHLIQSLAELTPGKAVVHFEHGVGRYDGLTKIETNGIAAEYLVLIYANEAKLYVPVSSLNLISRYLGGEDENAPINKLGSDAWQKSRQKAAEKIRDVAAELLDIYAQRELKSGFAFSQNKEEYGRFCQSFPYQTTEDQQSAIAAVLGDMCSKKSMDRLICGDVGFGKTEVAMRAAFLSVINQKQVAILVPTTLLAEQHFDNFSNRFANWPIQIETISRFKSAKEQKEIIKQLADGKIDIVIGTHKLIQDDIKWHNLGLLIVDEEHRFGVSQKEKIKAQRTNVDILTLTATPIPRTLNMAMSGMRDLSIIATPPARRLPVKTFVRESDSMIIREAILREVLRGGQVYFLHNNVATIEKTRQLLIELVPEARITIGHGQMNERELERVMNDFHHQRFNVLLCTTIIETGIDIPNANTIIIDRADKFGLAQLHQLRGRVGRSYHQAYAYLLTPPPKSLSKDSVRRLEAIASLENLGAGFVLATHDLEIRGAGELLGDDQSGQIESIGFTLYMEMLDEAVESLKSGKEPSLTPLLNSQKTDIELRLPALIPDDYIIDVNARLTLYKRIAATKDANELFSIKIEMADRFGALPDEVIFLFEISSLRLIASTLGITKVEFGENGGYIEFNEKNKISVDYLLSIIENKPNEFRLNKQNRLNLNVHISQRKLRIEYIKQLFEMLEKNQL